MWQTKADTGHEEIDMSYDLVASPGLPNVDDDSEVILSGRGLMEVRDIVMGVLEVPPMMMVKVAMIEQLKLVTVYVEVTMFMVILLVVQVAPWHIRW